MSVDSQAVLDPDSNLSRLIMRLLAANQVSIDEIGKGPEENPEVGTNWDTVGWLYLQTLVDPTALNKVHNYIKQSKTFWNIPVNAQTLFRLVHPHFADFILNAPQSKSFVSALARVAEQVLSRNTDSKLDLFGTRAGCPVCLANINRERDVINQYVNAFAAKDLLAELSRAGGQWPSPCAQEIRMAALLYAVIGGQQLRERIGLLFSLQHESLKKHVADIQYGESELAIWGLVHALIDLQPEWAETVQPSVEIARVEMRKYLEDQMIYAHAMEPDGNGGFKVGAPCYTSPMVSLFRPHLDRVFSWLAIPEFSGPNFVRILRENGVRISTWYSRRKVVLDQFEDASWEQIDPQEWGLKPGEIDILKVLKNFSAHSRRNALSGPFLRKEWRKIGRKKDIRSDAVLSSSWSSLRKKLSRLPGAPNFIPTPGETPGLYYSNGPFKIVGIT